MDATSEFQLQQFSEQRIYVKKAEQQPDIRCSGERYKNVLPLAVRDVGISVVSIASVIIVLQAADLGTRISADFVWWYGYILVGFWGGVMYIVTGALGINTYEKPTRRRLIAHLTLSIISASFVSAALVGMSIVCLVMSHDSPHHVCRSWSHCPELTIVRIVNSTLILLGAVQAILHIISAILCCWVFSNAPDDWKAVFITTEPPEEFQERLDFYPAD